MNDNIKIRAIQYKNESYIKINDIILILYEAERLNLDYQDLISVIMDGKFER